MARKKRYQHNGPLARWARERPFFFLTMALLFLLLAYPLFGGGWLGLVFWETIFLTVLVVGLKAAGFGRLWLPVFLGLWGTAAALDLAAYLLNWLSWIQFVNDLSSVIFLALSTTVLLRWVFNSGDATDEMIFAATSAYLLIGLAWAAAYLMVWHLVPGSFSGEDVLPDRDKLSMIYFSLVTMTTLGYGDITPMTPFAAMMAAVEAVVGQLYLAVLVAWLVGNVAGRRGRKG